MRILIVEDDLLVSEILQMLCAEQGHEYRTAEAVPAAAMAWREWSPHCILLDLKLPGDPGTVFVRHIRLMGDQTPIIVISGQVEPRWRTELEQFGVTAIVTKPFTPQHIVSLLQALERANEPE
jgi:DNA-binding response OmpR family regulator